MVAEAEAVLERMRRTSQRRRTSSISIDFWTSNSRLNSMEVERVRGALKRSLALAIRHTDRHLVVGTLKGFDQLMNLVLDDVQEVMRGRWFLLLQSNTGY